MFFYFFNCWVLLMLLCHNSRSISGEGACRRDLVNSVNLTTELHSDVLLPCYFERVLLGSDKTADIAVVWSQINATQHNLLEITLSGEVRPWDIKHGRIKTFPKFTESGNFSILLRKVQASDLGFYRCELFNGTGCSIAYQKIIINYLAAHTHSPVQRFLEKNWLFMAGGAGGVVLLVCFVLAGVCYRRQRQTHDTEDHCYANTGFRPDTTGTKITSPRGCGDRKSQHIYENRAPPSKVHTNQRKGIPSNDEIYVNMP